MKRFAIFLLMIVLVLAGCSSGQTAQTTEPAEAVTVVSSVDELLAAIAPGATIELAEGNYYLDSASNYGDRVGPYYIWTDMGMGEYGLQIQYVENLTIRGAGRGKTKLASVSRYDNVLTLMDCKNVTLDHMTLGHTQMTEACEGGVLHLDHSSDVSLTGLGLYGCGTTGVWGYESRNVTVQDCDVYDCSYSGISLSQCGSVRIQDCNVFSLGEEYPVSSGFDFWSCRDVTVENCAIRDNYVNRLILCDGSSDVVFRNNQFTDNRVSGAAFALGSGGVVFDNNSFQGNTNRSWYDSSYSAVAVDPEGKPVEFEAPVTETVEPGVAESVCTGEQKEVHVSNADQFLEAIASDTKILLDCKLLDLSTARNYGVDSEHYYWEDNYDGPSLVIFNVQNLTVEGAEEDRTASTISAVPRYAQVLTFDNCNAITVKNLTAGHTVEPGECMGGVLLFRYSKDLLVENCGLFGCGTLGVQTQYSQNLQIVNCEIYECSYGGVQFMDSENITLSGTTFRDLGGPVYNLLNCKNVTANGNALDGNYTGD